ncbi:hypothetical protein MCEMSE15_01472 [Fimbriimonadaceae bacterium]
MIYLFLFVLTMVGLLDNHPKRQLFWVVVSFVALVAYLDLGFKMLWSRFG